MPRKIELSVREDEETLRKLLIGIKKDRLRHRIKMLLLIKSGNFQYMSDLSSRLKYERRTIKNWINLYNVNGVDGLLEIKSGGNRKAIINKVAHQGLEKILRDPNTRMTSYVELLGWLKATYNIDIQYLAFWKYCKHHFKSKLKVSRRSHIKKDPMAEEVFKKTTPAIT